MFSQTCRLAGRVARWLHDRPGRLAGACAAGVVIALTVGLVLPVKRIHRDAGGPPATANQTTPGVPRPRPGAVARRPTAALPLVLGHRGGTERGYQNSMAAFNDAIALHLDYIETDVRHSSDGTAILIHNAVVPNECRPYRGIAVRALSAAKLARVRCAGQPVPRLADLVNRLRQPDALTVGLMAEVKDTDPLGVRDALAPLGLNRTIIESLNWDALGIIERASPQVPTCPLGVTIDRLAAALTVTHDCIGPDLNTATADLIARAHAAGVGVLVWTVNDTPSMRRLNAQGADGIITDRPRTAIALFKPGALSSRGKPSRAAHRARAFLAVGRLRKP